MHKIIISTEKNWNLVHTNTFYMELHVHAKYKIQENSQVGDTIIIN